MLLLLFVPTSRMTHAPSSSELMVRLRLRSDRGSADLKGEGINPESELVLDRLLVCEVVALVKGSTSPLPVSAARNLLLLCLLVGLLGVESGDRSLVKLSETMRGMGAG